MKNVSNLPLSDEWLSRNLDVLLDIHRAEFDENPRIYLKAVRATLIALGCTDSYVNGEFREWIESQFAV